MSTRVAASTSAVSTALRYKTHRAGSAGYACRDATVKHRCPIALSLALSSDDRRIRSWFVWLMISLVGFVSSLLSVH